MPGTMSRGDVEVDVLDASDLRFRGGTSSSIADEITAQHLAGYRTAVAHIGGPQVDKVGPANRLIRRAVDTRMATLILPGQRIRSRLAVFRHPAVVQHGAPLPDIEAERVVIVANAAPHDVGGERRYSVDQVSETLRARYGVDPVWAPVGPLVRSSLAGELGDRDILTEDWVTVIDADAWHVPRRLWASDRPVVGRHGRPLPQRWPSDPRTIRAVYPTDGSWEVRVLGGAGPVVERLGAVPAPWKVFPFGARSPHEFLAGLDFFVYYHHPEWVEPLGRGIVEALATGTVVVLPPHFRRVFGDAAIYAEPHDVRSVVNELYADRAAYEDQAARGFAAARQRFNHQVHVDRLAALIGHGSAPSRPRPVPELVGRRTTEPVLMVSSNGAGMGHLTRLLAMARHCPPQCRPHFLSLSQAVPVVGSFRLPYEYVASRPVTGFSSNRWHEYFRGRLDEVIRRLRPAAVVFDGTWPYQGFERVRADHPDLAWVWSRRGMWRPGHNLEQLAKAEWFDLVIEPGDFAAAADVGATATAPALRVGPVTLLDRHELVARDQARVELGLPDDRQVALVTLGAGNINDTTSELRVVIDALTRLGLDVCVTEPAIAVSNHISADAAIHVLSEYPLARHLNAFDVAVSAAGYNSFHELLRFGVPTLFVPNLQTALDDQQRRASYAAAQGWAHCLTEPDPDSVRSSVAELLKQGREMVDQVTLVDPGNGAAPAMDGVLGLLARTRVGT